MHPPREITIQKDDFFKPRRKKIKLAIQIPKINIEDDPILRYVHMKPIPNELREDPDDPIIDSDPDEEELKREGRDSKSNIARIVAGFNPDVMSDKEFRYRQEEEIDGFYRGKFDPYDVPSIDPNGYIRKDLRTNQQKFAAICKRMDEEDEKKRNKGK